MSGIDTSTPSTGPASSHPSDEIDTGPIDLNTLALPAKDIGQFVSRHIPVMRRPPALQFAKPIREEANVFEELVGNHAKRLQQREPDAVAYDLAELVIRRMPEIKNAKLTPSAQDGFEKLIETVRMFEHIYVARSGNGGQS